MKAYLKPLSTMATVIAILVIIKFALSSFSADRPSEASPRVPSVKSAKSVAAAIAIGTQQVGPFSDYQVIIDNDLVKPLGWEEAIPQEISRGPERPEPVRMARQERSEPVNSLILTGIVRIGGEPVALVEDSSDGKGHFLRAGDRLKNFVVKSVTDEDMTLVNGDSEIKASLGSSTQYGSRGGTPATGIVSEQAPEPSTNIAEKEADSSDTNSDNLSIIERMKARRRKELGQE